jgi:PEP-CTERM motif
MMTFLTACRNRGATWLIAVLVIAVGPCAARCAIPPPVDTIIQTTTNTSPPVQEQPGAPPPPPLTQERYPPGGGGTGSNGGPTIADVPEPASLVLALVGTGLAGVALWNRRGQRHRQQTVVA